MAVSGKKLKISACQLQQTLLFKGFCKNSFLSKRFFYFKLSFRNKLNTCLTAADV